MLRAARQLLWPKIIPVVLSGLFKERPLSYPLKLIFLKICQNQCYNVKHHLKKIMWHWCVINHVSFTFKFPDILQFAAKAGQTGRSIVLRACSHPSQFFHCSPGWPGQNSFPSEPPCPWWQEAEWIVPVVLAFRVVELSDALSQLRWRKHSSEAAMARPFCCLAKRQLLNIVQSLFDIS